MAKTINQVLLKRGTEANISGLSQGEMVYTTDSKQLFTGNGSGADLMSGTLVGTYANLPAAGVARRTYYATDLNLLLIDNGTSWEAVSANTKNHIINGNFDIWQRGTSFNETTLGTNSFYGPDRWKGNFSDAGGTVDANIIRTTGVNSKEYSARVALQFSGSRNGTTDYASLNYNMEGYDFSRLYDDYITLSFWVKSDTAEKYYVSFRDSTSSGSYVAPFTVNSADTWEFKTITVTMPPTQGTWITANSGLGMSIAFVIGTGTTYQNASTETWLSGNYLAGTDIGNGLFTATTGVGDFYLAQVQVEKGREFTGYQYEKWSYEYTRCLRYYEKSFNYATSPSYGSSEAQTYMGTAWGTTAMRATIPFTVRKRTANYTLTTYRGNTAGSGSDANWAWFNPGVGWAQGTNSQIQLLENTFLIDVAATVTSGNSYLLNGSWVVDADF